MQDAGFANNSFDKVKHNNIIVTNAPTLVRNVTVCITLPFGTAAGIVHPRNRKTRHCCNAVKGSIGDPLGRPKRFYMGITYTCRISFIRPGAECEAEAVALHVRYKNVGMADGLIPAKIDKFFEDLSETLSRQLYGALQNAVKDDDTLAEMLADEDADHYDDIKKGIAAIKSLIESEDTKFQFKRPQ